MSEAKFVYKIFSEDDIKVAEGLGHSQTALDVGDGFVHLSTLEQVPGTLKMFFAGSANTVLIEFPTTGLDGELKWEAAPTRPGDLFPHLYGTLHLKAGTRRWTLALGEDGTPKLPEDVSKLPQ